MRTRLAILAAALSLSPLAACGDAGDAERSLAEAQATLAALHSTPGAAPPEFVVRTHDQIRRDLSSLAGADGAASRAAALLIIGQTHAGDAELAARESEAREAAATDLLAEAQTLAGRLYIWRHARADAAGQTDVQPEVAELQERVTEAQRERRELIERREQMERRIADLRSSAESAAQEASMLRGREVELRDQALTQEPQQRAETIQRVYRAQREADEANRRASDLLARVSLLEPELREIEQEIAGTDRLIELLRASRESLEERQARTARTAQVDREQASLAAGDLENVLSELHELRAGDLVEAYQRAESSFERSLRNLRSASSAGASATWLAAAQLGSAQLADARSAGARRYARFLNTMAEMEPRLPYAGDLASRAREASELAEAQLRRAREGYEAAASTYSRLARGPQAERVRALADRLSSRAAGRTEPATDGDESAPELAEPAEG